MLIITDKVGQLANRLFQYSYIIANAIENNYSVINLNFEDYSEFFEATSKSKYAHFKIKNSLFSQWPKFHFLIQKITLKFSKFLIRKNIKKLFFFENLFFDNERFDLNNTHYQKIAKHKIVLIGGSWYFDYPNFIKHADFIRSFFKPTPKYINIIDEVFNEVSETGTILIGVHIRKGDYKHFLNGIHYFENDIYIERMKQAEELIGGKIKFLLCSNEAINLNEFKNFNVFTKPNHFIVDLYLLAKCDYILGPLSTFSMWASFYGKKPLWQITNEKINLCLSDFQIKDYC